MYAVGSDFMRRCAVAGVAVPSRFGPRWWGGCARRGLGAVVVVVFVVAGAPGAAAAQGGGFGDVEAGSHKPAIDALDGVGLFEGTLCGEGMFCPGEPIERSVMAVWLIRALGDADVGAAAVGSSRFADVDAAEWWAPFVERLAQLEITVGCRQEPLRYCPHRVVSRAQMASFLVRAFDLGEAPSSAGFVDTAGSTHESNIDALAASGITVGCSQEPLRYCPDEPVSRAQMASFLARALGLVEAPSPAATTTTLEPEGGHPPRPSAGLVPRQLAWWDYPTCSSGPPWPSDCYPPSEWETPQDLSDCWRPFPDEGVGGICPGRRPPEVPRQTQDVVDWTQWCTSAWHPVSCENILFEIKWSLDYLGAHPWCVLQQYVERVVWADQLWSRGYSSPPADFRNRHGWHLCPTVIDPGIPEDPWVRLSETGITLAEQCRIVLPADIELEDRPLYLSDTVQRFGSDCDAWARWVETEAPHWPCNRSARLAEEWMEHHYSKPEISFSGDC